MCLEKMACGRLIAAIGVVIVIALGVVFAIRGTHDSPQWTPELGAVPAEAVSGNASLCGLRGLSDSGTLAATPEADWRYQGTTAYPVSRVHGPGRTAPEEFRYCFQHTPEGALFAAANAVVQGDGAIADEWIEYALAEGPHRSKLVAFDGSPSEKADTRSNIVGFRILHYAAATARVDVAVRLSVPEGTVLGSAVYELVWADGDWKISTDSPEPIGVALIPDLIGYVPWSEAS